MKKGLLLLFVFLFFVGCYEDNIHVYEDSSGGLYGQDSTEIYFFKFLSAWQPAAGLTAFPDGGTPRMLINNLSFYRLDRDEDHLQRIYNFGDLPYQKSRWRTFINKQDSIITFGLNPLNGWEREITFDEKIRDLQQKIGGYFVYDPWHQTVDHFFVTDSVPAGDPRDIRTSQLKRMLVDITFKQWGLDLPEISDKTESDFIDDLVQLNGNRFYRQAVVEQIVSDMTFDQIVTIIDRMQDYRNQLNGLEQTEYDFAAEQTLQLLNQLKEDRR
jgi:hypothetical protein